MSNKTKVTLKQGDRVVELELDGTIEDQIANLFSFNECPPIALYGHRWIETFPPDPNIVYCTP